MSDSRRSAPGGVGILEVMSRPDTDTPSGFPKSMPKPKTLTIVPIPRAELDRLRAQGHDDAGNPWEVISGGRGRPVRCCLNRTTIDERIVLISYRPVRPANGMTSANRPYDEAGPVFVHADPCDGPDGDGFFPIAWRASEQVLRAYSHQGELLAGVLTRPDEDRFAVAEKLLADPDAEFVHSRSVGAGCFSFEIRPA